MAYVTVEDDGGSIELLCFAKALEKYGRLLKEGTPVVVRGKLSVRDEKPPQILCDTVFPLADGAPAPQRESSSVVQPVEGKMLWLRCPSADHPGGGAYPPGIRHVPRPHLRPAGVRRYRQAAGATCLLTRSLLDELEDALGKENVVVQ